jgi:hypothetical protein
VGMLLSRPRGSRGRFKMYVMNVAAALVLVAAIFVINETGYGLGKFGGSLHDTIEQFEAQEQRDTVGGAAYPEWMRLSGGLGEAWKIPVRYVTFLFSPLVPFMVRQPGHLLGALDAGLYLLLFLALARNWRAVIQNRPFVVVLVVVLTLFLVYSLGVSNFGTAIRHRAKIVPLLILIAVGLPLIKRIHRGRAALSPRELKEAQAAP